jgi:hypothetical protein
MVTQFGVTDKKAEVFHIGLPIKSRAPSIQQPVGMPSAKSAARCCPDFCLPNSHRALFDALNETLDSMLVCHVDIVGAIVKTKWALSFMWNAGLKLIDYKRKQ